MIGRSQALEAGLSRYAIHRRVSSGAWEEILWGVYRLPGATESWHQSLMSCCLWGGADTVASHRSAAALHGLDGDWGKIIEFSVPPHLRPPARGISHQLEVPEDHRTVVRSIPVTTPLRTIIDLAAVIREAQLEVALDSALRMALIEIPDLWMEITEGSRRRWGMRKLRRVVAFRSGGPTESPLEVRVLQLFRKSGLPEPELQYEVRLTSGRTARIDLCYPRRLLAIEVDGHAYHSSRSSWQSDLSRMNSLTELGWRVIRITNEDLKQRSDQVVQQIRGLLADASPRVSGVVLRNSQRGA